MYRICSTDGQSKGQSDFKIIFWSLLKAGGQPFIKARLLQLYCEKSFFHQSAAQMFKILPDLDIVEMWNCWNELMLK